MFQKRTNIVLFLIETYRKVLYSLFVENKYICLDLKQIGGENVVQLMIIADDFTGALDTGVHFAEKGIPTRVIVSSDGSSSQKDTLNPEQAAVLVIDAETRHVSKEQAFRKVYDIVAGGKKAGIPYIYKKTDSALRGNIGSELEAALAASGEKHLAFIPAFPQMNRVTKGGKQYIDGVPVSQSVFGTDPFEPVAYDSVKEIIRLQSQIPVREGAKPDEGPGQESGIVVFDAETEDDIRRIGKNLTVTGRSRLFAGCAGFALVLPELLGLRCQVPAGTVLEEKLFVICGSVNPITRKQMAYGESAGYPRVYMAPKEKLDREFWKSEAGDPFIRQLLEDSRNYDCVMLDSNDQKGQPKTLDYAREKGMDTEQVRQGISDTFGIILKKMLDRGLQAVILVTGGDTLLGFMNEIGLRELQPIREIRPGCVLTKLFYGSREYHIITKSGGFGKEDLLWELTNELKGR